MDSGQPEPETTSWIGQSVLRKEDRRLLTGGGRYADDVHHEGETWGVPVRSTVAHGVLNGIDTDAAMGVPGVLAVLTAADLEEVGVKPFPCGLPHKSRDGSGIKVPDRYALARGKVRHAGEMLAFVIAETEAAARDGAEAVEADITPEPAVTSVHAAVEADAPQLHDDVPGNVILDWVFGDEAAADQVFADAAHVTRLTMPSQRVAPAPMEPRTMIARWEPDGANGDGQFVLNTGCQGAFGLSNGLAGLLGVDRSQVRVLVGDVGGSFGMKGGPYPEYLCALVGARKVGRPVRWRDDRTDSFLADQAGRDIEMTGELALDADGNILAVRLTGFANMGAYVTAMAPHIGTVNIQKNAASLYKTPLLVIASRCVLTNTPPIGPYRGAGRPDGNLFMDRLMEAAARETGRDPVAFRRQNLIAADAMPFEAASGQSYDSGNFEAVLDRAVTESDWDGYAERAAASDTAGRIRGRGIACYLEATAPQGKEMGGLRFSADGRVTIVTGTLDYGQGHRSAFAQVAADRLGVDIDRIDLLQGDSAELLIGGGTGGSRSIMASGKAISDAAESVIEKGRALAAEELEVAAEDVEWQAGAFRVAGTDREITLLDLAAKTAGREGEDATLDVGMVVESPPSAFPNGCHVCEVELDPDTGEITVDRYTAVNDFGTIINPMLVTAQVHGGVTQGLGQVLMEGAVFDEDGQCLSGSFMDYAMPRASDVPNFVVASEPSPCTTNPLGAKGCGEAGTTGALPAVMNAVLDALAQRGVADIAMPVTPHRVWQALRSGTR